MTYLCDTKTKTEKRMKSVKPYSLCINGRLMTLERTQVMGILNVTPDSFYAASRKQTEAEIAARTEQMIDEGAAFIDIGACSTRPGAPAPSEAEECERLRMGLRVVRQVAPDVPVSIDTYRASAATLCVEEFGAGIINDISGGEMDAEMFPTVARLGVPYVLMHMQGTPQTMQQEPHYTDVTAEVLNDLQRKANRLHELGVKDVIIDPGFGFGKTLAHNYELMANLDSFRLLDMPLLVGISRKSMIYRLLESSPEEALTGTSALNTWAAMEGAHILRVHDVKAAVECVRIVEEIRKYTSCS